MVHELKCKKEYFYEIASGRKAFEVRKNDRNFKVGDYLALNCIDENDNYTDQCYLVLVTTVFDQSQYVKDGFVILSIIGCDVREGCFDGGNIFGKVIQNENKSKTTQQ